MIELRSAAAGDLEPLVDLTIRAFQDIQDGIRGQLGDALFEPQNGDWRGDYRRTLQELVARESAERTIVALADGRVTGFAAWTTHEGRRLKVWRTALPVRGEGVAVPTGDVPIELVEVQPEGKGRMPATAWANGVRWRPGDRLGP